MDIMANPKKARGAAEKALVLVAVCLAALSMPLTFTGPAVALPAIGRSLGGSPIALYWVTNAFMLTFGSSLMAAGALADAYGRKRMFLTGVAAFGLFSALASVSPSIFWLDLAWLHKAWRRRLPLPAVRRPWRRNSRARGACVPFPCSALPSASVSRSVRSPRVF